MLTEFFHLLSQLFQAHEVRNPLTSAICALSFVSATTNERIKDDEVRRVLNHDIRIAESSLNFINELLRNMLDINRATNHQIKINVTPSDLLRDILEPAASILCMRVAKESVKISTDCPSDLIVSTDQLRLKQIILNLAVNSTKFVNEGFIRLRAEKSEGSVMLYVEDSGPGLPPDKQDDIFQHRQDSFDLLSQGTGIGLYVCKYLCNLMGAEIYLDKSYDSGIKGCPGARFVIDLRCQPIESAQFTQEFCSSAIDEDRNMESIDPSTHRCPPEQLAPVDRSAEIPDNLNALFVDDDIIVRKLFIRSVRRCCPSWKIDEASNGEAALQMIEKASYDVIFVDQYMPGIARPLLGTETIRIMRINGVKSVICGCSANEMEAEFLQNGADIFIMKPFPCEKESLHAELQRVLNARNANETPLVKDPPKNAEAGIGMI